MTRAELLMALRDANVTYVWSRYDGYNDEGWCKPPHFDSVGLEVDPTLTQRVQSFFERILEDRYPGWENNDGACGVFEWDIRHDTLDLGHDVRHADRFAHRL